MNYIEKEEEEKRGKFSLSVNFSERCSFSVLICGYMHSFFKSRFIYLRWYNFFASKELNCVFGKQNIEHMYSWKKCEHTCNIRINCTKNNLLVIELVG